MYIIIIIILIIFIFIIYISIKYPGLFLPSCTDDDISGISHIVGEYDIFDDMYINEIIESVGIMEQEDCSNTINSVMDVVGYPTYIYPGNITNDDIYDKNSLYYSERNKHNNILLDNVSFIYPIIINKLKYITGKECEYPTYKKGVYKHTKHISDYIYSLPGFHIFKGGSWLGSGWDVASLHVDLQFNKLNFESNILHQFDMDDVFSFTIPIQMPDNSGLYIYDKTREDISDALPLSYSMRNYKKYKINYDVGKMYIHDGLHYHMISSFVSDVDHDRITIQGHGIYCKTTHSYWIYW